MTKLKWIIFAVVVLAVFGGIIFLNKSNETTFTGDAAKIITDGPIADRVRGTDAQKVVLIEYADFQCPGCGKMYSTVHELTEKYSDKVTFIFRNFPLTNIHPNALAASTAAEAAGKQGKFFEMHDMLFATQAAWSAASLGDRGQMFENYAGQLGLNMDQFKADLTSKDITEKINRDIATGKNQFKANSTPTFILNGQKVGEDKAINPEELTKLIDDAVKAAYPDEAQ